VHRIIRHAFEFAKGHGLTRVCMADKSNAMTAGHALWQRVFRELAPQFPAIEPTHYYIDALAMYMVLDPKQFQVIVTNNLFGDIITDLAAAFQGGLGMAASGNIHPGKTSMFEPVHGSAPKFAGKNVANPIGAIGSAALMLETLGLEAEARAIDRAIAEAVNAGDCTADIGGALGTRESGDAIIERLTPHEIRNNQLNTDRDQTGGGEKGRRFF
jgi:3-isopropylmalate dehydrogenase